jgi:hypothetical protein
MKLFSRTYLKTCRLKLFVIKGFSDFKNLCYQSPFTAETQRQQRKTHREKMRRAMRKRETEEKKCERRKMNSLPFFFSLRFSAVSAFAP